MNRHLAVSDNLGEACNRVAGLRQLGRSASLARLAAIREAQEKQTQ